VRSGARRLDAGALMDTVLNLGWNDTHRRRAGQKVRHERFAFDCYRRFIECIPPSCRRRAHEFEEALEQYKRRRRDHSGRGASRDDWRAVVTLYKEIVAYTGRGFSSETRISISWGDQGGFSSWMNHRAIVYRELHNIPADWAPPSMCKVMVFGNMER